MTELSEYRATMARLSELKEDFQEDDLTWTAGIEIATYLKRRRDILADAPKNFGLCACLGKLPGEPACRCWMRDNVFIIDGRYVEIQDLGEVK